MKAGPVKPAAPRRRSHPTPRTGAVCAEEIDLALLEESLAKTVWERMLANDDALHLAGLLHAAMLKKRAES